MLWRHVSFNRVERELVHSMLNRFSCSLSFSLYLTADQLKVFSLSLHSIDFYILLHTHHQQLVLLTHKHACYWGFSQYFSLFWNANWMMIKFEIVENNGRLGFEYFSLEWTVALSSGKLEKTSKYSNFCCFDSGSIRDRKFTHFLLWYWLETFRTDLFHVTIHFFVVTTYLQSVVCPKKVIKVSVSCFSHPSSTWQPCNCHCCKNAGWQPLDCRCRSVLLESVVGFDIYLIFWIRLNV